MKPIILNMAKQKRLKSLLLSKKERKWNTVFNIFGGTATEIKRDKYKKLYDKLVEAILDHEEKVAAAEASYNSYISTVPNLSNSKIPSNDFDPKREEKNAKLLQYFEKDKDKKTSLITAKNSAYQKYLYYRQKAIEEARDRD